MKPHILFVTALDDPSAKRVERELHRRGAEVSWFDAADFPARAHVSAGFGRAGESLRLDLPHGAVPLDRLTAIWYRRSGSPTAAADIADPALREVIEKDCADFLTSLWDLTGCRALPAPLDVLMRTQRKAPQLQRARALGFTVPPTLFTNDPHEFLNFHREQNGRLVSKITGAINMSKYSGDDFGRYTEVVSTRDVAYSRSVEYCPMIFQAYVPKQLELRITVVGTRAFAVEIHSQAANHTTHDWRRYDLGSTLHRVHELPEQVERLCTRLLRELGLLYGAIDMILTPDGQYVFLEINPCGEYGWIEHLTGLPISAAIAEVLLGWDPMAPHLVSSKSAEECHA
jgi:hypothetical protein